MLAPENTAVAFDLALGHGAHVLETDVRLSRDGVVFVTHDDTLERTTNGSGKVRDHSADELVSLNAGYHFKDLEGRSARDDRIRLLTLEHLFERYPSCGINIDIKDRDPAAARAVADVIARHADHHDVNVGSFHASVLHRFREVAPEISTAASRQEVAALYFGPPWPGSRLAHRPNARETLAPPYRVLQIPRRYGPFNLSSRHLLQRARQRNVQVVYWTINEAAAMQALIDLGADGIVTDRPDIAATLPAFNRP